MKPRPAKVTADKPLPPGITFLGISFGDECYRVAIGVTTGVNFTAPAGSDNATIADAAHKALDRFYHPPLD